MQELNAVDYYSGRERQERALADRSTDRAIAAIHHTMAERYRALVRQAKPGDPAAG